MQPFNVGAHHAAVAHGKVETVAVRLDGDNGQPVFTIRTLRAGVALLPTLGEHAALAVPPDEAAATINVEVAVLVIVTVLLQAGPGESSRADPLPVIRLARHRVGVAHRLVEAANLSGDVGALAIDGAGRVSLRLDAEAVVAGEASLTLLAAKQRDRYGLVVVEDDVVLVITQFDALDTDAGSAINAIATVRALLAGQDIAVLVDESICNSLRSGIRAVSTISAGSAGKPA